MNRIHDSIVTKVDFSFLSVLLSLVLIAHVLFRGAAIQNFLLLECIFVVFWLSVSAFWIITIRWLSKTRYCRQLLGVPGEKYFRFDKASLSICATLFASTILTFVIPLRKGYWHGYDDSAVIWYGDKPDMISAIDLNFNRPFMFVPAYIANLLTPQSVDSYLYIAIASHFLSALFLFGILRLLLPNAKVIPLLAALFLIVSPTDNLRYMMISLVGYYWTVTTLLAAIFLFIKSYRSRNRALLLASCVLLNFSLLAASEAGYPVACIIPFLLLSQKTLNLRSFSTWSTAWYGIIFAAAVRLILFLTGSNKSIYQLKATGLGNIRSFDQLSKCLAVQNETLANYLDGGGLQHYWGFALLIAIFTLASVWLYCTKFIPGRTWQKSSNLFIPLVVALLAMELGVIAYLGFDTPSRTQFFAAPAQATCIAILCEGMASILWIRQKAALVSILSCVIVALSVSASMQNQDEQTPHIRFENSIKIFSKIRKLAPAFKPNTVVLLLLQDRTPTTSGANYSFQALIADVLQCDGFMINFDDPLKCDAQFLPDSIVLKNPVSGTDRGRGTYHYEQAVIFLVTPQGDVSLMRSFPEFLLPQPQDLSSRYKPEARILESVDSPQILYAKESFWMPKARYQRSILPDTESIILGERWGVREEDDKDIFHWIDNDPELVFPNGNDTLKTPELIIEASLGPSAGPFSLKLDLCDDHNKIISTDILNGKNVLNFSLPTLPTGQILHLHAHSPNNALPWSKRRLNFRVFKIARAASKLFVGTPFETR